MTWKPIINGEEALPLAEKIVQFAQILKNQSLLRSDIGLLTGRMGIVLFLYYYSLYAKQDEFRDIAYELIGGIFDQIEISEVPHTFCEGLAGTGWGLNHLIEKGFIEADIDDIFAELDHFSAEVLQRNIQESNYDYLQGAVGIGLYLLGRHSRQPAMDSLQTLLDNLEQHAVRGPNNTIHWQTLIDPSDGTMGCNLSLSHGIAGIVNLLARMAHIDRFRPQAVPLVNGACGYLLEQQFNDPGQNSFFPGFISPKNSPAYSRLAWCYGDLGVALGFSHAFQATGISLWREAAGQILLHSTKRRESPLTGVQDACVCHGSAGIAHIFNRSFQQSGDIHLREAAVFWLNDSLKHAKYPDGYAGYKMRHPDIKGGWKPEANLLEGIAGLGLVFISAISTIEPAWDQCLMIG